MIMNNNIHKVSGIQGLRRHGLPSAISKMWGRLSVLGQPDELSLSIKDSKATNSEANLACFQPLLEEEGGRRIYQEKVG